MITNTAGNTFQNGAILPVWRSIVIALVGIGVFWLCYATRSSNTATEAGVIMELPIFVDAYMGTEQEASLSEKEMLPGDTKIIKKNYTTLAGKFTGDSINCQIVLSGGEKRSIHRPEVCLPGQGWIIKDGRQVPVKLDNGKTMSVMKLTLSRTVEVGPGDRREITNEFFYWFVGKDKTTAQHSQRILLTSWDRVFHDVNHRWAYVIVSAPVYNKIRPNAKTQAEVVKELKDFIGKVAPQIQKASVIPS